MKKGFTLVELISVIILLGVLSLIVIPIVTNQINDTKKLTKENQIATIKEAANMYSIKHDLGKTTTNQKLSLDTLVDAGMLEEKNIQDENQAKLTGCVLYKWRPDINDYEFTYDENCS